MSNRERLSSALLALATAIAILCVGSAFRWTEAIVAAVVAAAVCTQITSRRCFADPPRLMLFLGAAALLTALQLVPLPHLLLAQLQPTGHALRGDGAALAGTEPWQAITLDAPGTLRGLAFFVILLGVAWLGLRLTVSSRGRYRVLAIIAACCGLAAVVTGVHELLGADSLYGLYDPELGRPVVLGPLLNANHLGCLMGVGVMTGIGLALHARQPTWVRIAWVAVVIACAITAVATRSRGATLALVAGAFVTGALVIAGKFLGEERRRKPGYLTTIPIAVVAVSTIVVIVYASAGGVSKELARTTFDEVQNPHSKFAIWRAAAELLEESPWVGVGRGAFEPTITHAHPAAAFASFSHVENEYLQAAVDWGIPGALLLGGLLVWVFVRGVRRWQDGPLLAGAFGGLAVIALQSVVDFGVQLLALAIPATLLLATISYIPLRDAPERRRRAFVMRGLVIAGLGLAMLALLSPATTSVAEDHRALRRRDDLTLAEIQPALARHPLDYYSHALAAQALYRVQDRRAVMLLNHAMRLHPSHPGLHQIAARALLQAGRQEQAAIEYAAALRSTNVPDKLIAEIAAQFPPALAATAIPVDVPNFDAVMQLLPALPRANEIIRLWLVRILQLRPNDLRACDALYALAAQRRDELAAAEASTRCADHALDAESKVMLARMLYDKGRYTEVAKLLRDVDSWRGLVSVRVRGWLIACDAETARARWDEAKRCLRRLDVSGLLAADTRAQVTTRLEQIERKLRAQTPP